MRRGGVASGGGEPDAATERVFEAAVMTSDAAMRRDLQQLLGTEAATLGPALAEQQLAQLGVPSTPALFARIRGMANRVRKLEIGGGSTVERLVIAPVAAEDCATLADFLVETWGDEPWVDEARQTRAHLEVDGDDDERWELVIERYARMDEWLRLEGDHARAATLPVWAIGKHSDELDAWVGERASVGGVKDQPHDNTMTWHDVGPGPRGYGRTQLSALIIDGVVIGVAADVQGDPDEREAVRAYLTRVLGKPTKGTPDRADQRAWDWAHVRPMVQLTLEDGGFELSVAGLQHGVPQR